MKRPLQKRCRCLASRCFTGFDVKDKLKKNPIQEWKALEDWKELLEKRFPQPVSGGRPFVLKIAKVVKDKKTPEGLDLIGKSAILEHLAKWCERMCTEHSTDPGSEATQALLQHAHGQQALWHEDLNEELTSQREQEVELVEKQKWRRVESCVRKGGASEL